MKKKFIDIRDIINSQLNVKNKNIFIDLKFPYQKELANKKIYLISDLINREIKNRQSKKFWNEVLYFWTNRIVGDFCKCYLFFQKNFKKNKTYIIYNIDPSEFANHDTSYTVDPEKFIIFLASEYIKQKKFNFIIKEKFVEKPLQNKFSKFHLNEVYSKNKIKKLHFLISKLFFKFYRPKIIFDDLMIKYSDMIKLNLALGQLPLQWSIRYNAFKNKYNLEKRVLLINSIKSKIFYDNYLNSILIKILPSGYLENFDEIVEHVLKTYPLKYSSYISDNISSLPSKKIFIQLMKTKGTKIFIIQHGGMYGFLENKIGEISERLMSNNFLTWGWKRTNKDKIFFSLKFLNLQKNSKSTGSNNKILICSNLRTNYFNVITAQPSCPKICDENWENLKIFCSFFNKKFKEEINIRYLKKTQNSGFEFNEKKFPKFIKFDHAKDKLKNVLSQFKLVVHDGLYSTAFLETLYLDKPTLALINPKDIKDYSFEFRKEINNLKNIGMIHTNVKSLKKFLLKNYLSIDDWWKNEKVKKVLKKFKNTYLRNSKSYVEDFNKLIN